MAFSPKRDTSATRTRGPSSSQFDAAVAATLRGWPVFPMARLGKVPAIKRWEAIATIDRAQLEEWWAFEPDRNVGVACGPAGLVVIDLDDVRGHLSGVWGELGVRHGREVLALLAQWAGEADPVDTYTVLTPSGEHRYYLAPTGRRLRSTVGASGCRGLGPAVDVRAWGGAAAAAGSVRLIQGRPWMYRRDPGRPDEPAPLPQWLATRLTPPPPQPRRPIQLRSDDRLDAYVAAAVHGEAANVAAATPGTRAIVVFRAAYKLGGLVGAEVLDDTVAEHALLDAASAHNGVDGWTPREARGHVRNGIALGRKRPRRLGGLAT